MSLTRLPWARPFGRYPQSSLDRRPADSVVTRGPELVTLPYSQWTFSDPSITGNDATGLHFLNAPSNANARCTIVTKDDTEYEVIVVVANRTGGNFVNHIYGPTSGHHSSGATISTNGTFTQKITTTGASSILSQIRLICAASSTFDVSSVSVKEVLVPGS